MNKNVRLVSIALALFLLTVLPLPILGMAESQADSYTYEFPDEQTVELDSRYVRVEVDKLDACLYAFLNTKGEVEFRILSETLRNDNGEVVETQLLKATIQDAKVYDEDQPDILITAHLGDGSEDAFCTKLDKNTKKKVTKDGMLTVETELGDITFDVNYIVNPKKATPTPNPGTTGTKPPTTQTPGTTPKPSGSSTPSAAPSPTATQKPTATPEVRICPYCGMHIDIRHDTTAHYQEDLAWYNEHIRKHESGQITPSPSPTPSGHWETVWVVDVPAQSHTEFVCNICGHHSMSTSENNSHQEAHLLAGEGSGWHNENVIDVPEQGHWEKVWVVDP